MDPINTILKVLAIAVPIFIAIIFLRKSKDWRQEEIIGKPIEFVVGLLLIFGSPLLLLYSISKFFLVNLIDVFYITLIIFLISFIFTVIFQNKLFPWGKKHLIIKLCGLIVLPVVLTMLLFGLFLTINGAFDQSDIKIRASTVTKKTIGGPEHNVYYLHLEADWDKKVKLDQLEIKQREYDQMSIGSKVLIKSKTGFLKKEWFIGHDLDL